ncbi:MAG TPA: ATP-binding protein, partial [Chloroflexota bacterium]|nr:ATP-binding protein [Chloroflexota bacterium]
MNPNQFYETALERAGRALVESEQTFQFLLTALLVGGNVLLEGVPGTAKTLMARTLAQLLAGSDPENNTSVNGEAHHAQRFQRIQFTP